MLVIPDVRVLAASVAGASHARAGLPCQDAFAWRRTDDTLVLAVADGLGSAGRSDEGARAAVEAAVASTGEPAERVAAARGAIESLGGPLPDFACTLLVVRLGPSGAQAAHVGDGAAVARAPDGLVLLSPPASSEYVNEVTPLTAEGWQDSVRVSPVVQADAVALFTDGCMHAAVAPDGSPGERFLAPLLSYAAEPDASEGQIAALLAGPKMSEHSDDDKTLVLAVRL